MKTIARLAVMATLFAAPVAASAQTHGFVPCEDHWSAAIRNIWVTDDGEGVRSFAQGAVRLIRIDTEEPAVASGGVVLLMPDGDGSEEPIGVACYVNWGYGIVDVDETQASYDPATGLTLTIPTQTMSLDTNHMVERPIRIRIDLGSATLTPLD
jgi:hypothetical protein